MKAWRRVFEEHTTLNDGVVKIYEVANTAPAGGVPVEEITLKQTLRYKERTVG